MTPRSKRPVWFLVGGVILVAALVGLRPRLQQAVMLRTALAEPSVSAELIEELIAHDSAPLAVIERFFRSGKLPHRIAALRAVSRSSVLSQIEGLPGWLQDAALDIDFQVREQALGILSTLRPPGAAPLIRASLLDVDPELKHVAIRAAVAVGATNLIADVAGLLDHHSLNVRIAAATALRQWTGHDFDVRRAHLGGAYNDLSSVQKEVNPEALARVEAGLGQWKLWWSANGSAWKTPEVSVPKSSEVHRPAPEFSLPDLEGKQVRLSGLRGRPVLVNFWATWCTACWSELPELVKLHDRHGDKLVILGISLDGLPDQHELDHGHKETDHADGDDHDHGTHSDAADKTTPRAALVNLVGGFAKAKGLNYPILLDPEGVTSLLYQGNELPVNVLIDAEGNLRRRFVGPRSPEAFDAMIAAMTGGRAGGQD